MKSENTLAVLEPKIRNALGKGSLVEFETHGHSMIPLLHDGGDKVVLQKSEGKLKVNDVVLCKTDDGRYVLHRITDVCNGGYALKGDNCISGEFCKSDEDVIGKAVAFIRRGKRIDVNSFKYRFYVRHRKLFLRLWQCFWKIADNVVKWR